MGEQNLGCKMTQKISELATLLATTGIVLICNVSLKNSEIFGDWKRIHGHERERERDECKSIVTSSAALTVTVYLL